MTDVANVQIHWMRTAQLSEAMVLLLDEDTRRRAASIAHPSARHRFLAGRALTLLALAPALGVAPQHVPPFDRRCEHCGGPHGRPRLSGSGLGFSLTRSGDLVAVATFRAGDAAVGLDLEPRTMAPSALPGLDDLLAPGEVLEPGSAQGNRAHALLRTWTRKEAVLKATGHGLAVPMREVQLSRTSSGRWRTVGARVGAPSADPVALVDVDLPGQVGAVAVVGVESIDCSVYASGESTPSEEEAHHGAAAPFATYRARSGDRAGPGAGGLQPPGADLAGPG